MAPRGLAGIRGLVLRKERGLGTREGAGGPEGEMATIDGPQRARVGAGCGQTECLRRSPKRRNRLRMKSLTPDIQCRVCCVHVNVNTYCCDRVDVITYWCVIA